MSLTNILNDATVPDGSPRGSPSCTVAAEKTDFNSSVRAASVIVSNGTDGSHSAGGNTILQQKRQNYAKRWCFTWNNYEKTNDWEKLIKERFGTVGTKTIVIGKEVASTGTKHLQGYVEFNDRTRPIEKIGIPNIHWEVAKGNNEQNYLYCVKEKDILLEKGTDIIKSQLKKKDIKVIDNLRPWQEFIIKTYKEHEREPNDRIIYWVYDKAGNNGKSALAKLLVVKHGFGYLSNAKTADIACYCSSNIKDGYVLDFSRSFQDSINYGAIENLKNGLLFSSKYESMLVVMNSPFLVCFSNQLPCFEKMSTDRWRILDLSKSLIQWEKKKKDIEFTLDDIIDDNVEATAEAVVI